MSCKPDAHASWDRECPEFQRRCAQFDENYPVNNLQYFPTEEEWALIPRPNRLQLSEKFPARYTVSAYPQSGQSDWMPGPRNTNKQGKRKQVKLPVNKSTMDRYLGPGGEADTTSPYYDCKNSRDVDPGSWN
jgi:hypothetical protein